MNTAVTLFENLYSRTGGKPYPRTTPKNRFRRILKVLEDEL